MELDEINQQVVYCTQEQLIFDHAKPKEHETYMCQMLEIVNRIAGILYYKQDHIDDILKFMHKLCDNLNRGRPDFVVRSLRETEGIFCMDTIVWEVLALHSFANSVMRNAEEDFCVGRDPYITNVSDEFLESL